MTPVSPEQARCNVEGAGRGSFRTAWIVLESGTGCFQSPTFPVVIGRDWLRVHFRDTVDSEGERVYRWLRSGEPSLEIREQRTRLVLLSRGTAPDAQVCWKLDGRELDPGGLEIAPPNRYTIVLATRVPERVLLELTTHFETY